MTKLTFYRQVRKDGGIRTGVEVNEDPVLGQFQEGDQESDSALEWFVDVRCSVSTLGHDPEEARRWLLRHALVIQTALKNLAEELKPGMDSSSVLRRRIAGAPTGVQMEIVCSALRRVTGQEMATVLLDLGTRWPGLIRGLPALESTPA